MSRFCMWLKSVYLACCGLGTVRSRCGRMLPLRLPIERWILALAAHQNHRGTSEHTDVWVAPPETLIQWFGVYSRAF